MLTPSDRFLNFSRCLLSLLLFSSCEQLQRQQRYLFVIHLHEAASRTDETPRVDHVEQLRGSVRIGEPEQHAWDDSFLAVSSLALLRFRARFSQLQLASAHSSLLVAGLRRGLHRSAQQRNEQRGSCQESGGGCSDRIAPHAIDQAIGELTIAWLVWADISARKPRRRSSLRLTDAALSVAFVLLSQPQPTAAESSERIAAGQTTR